MTGTDLSLFESLGARADIFSVNAGVFARQVKSCLLPHPARRQFYDATPSRC